jgi:hypothetical protein
LVGLENRVFCFLAALFPAQALLRMDQAHTSNQVEVIFAKLDLNVHSALRAVQRNQNLEALRFAASDWQSLKTR